MHIVQSAGGVERYLKMFFENTNPDKIENILVCSYDYNKSDFKGTKVEQVEYKREINLIADVKATIKTRRIIKKYNPDIIYMHSSKAGAIGRIANLGIKNKAYYNPHGWAFNMDCGMKKYIYIWIEKILSRCIDKIVAISLYEKQSAIKNNVCKEEKIEVIYNGIDIGKYNKMSCSNKITRELLGISSDAYIIGTVGRISKQKAPDTFVKAAYKIKKEIPNAFFIIVGDGEEREKIESLISKYDMKESFMITGWINEPIDYIKIFDQAMLLSRWEGFGLVLAEYMYANKPIVATKVDGIINLIKDNENGCLVNVDNITDICDSVIKIRSSLSFRDKIVKNGAKIVKNNFNVTRVIKEHEILFELD